MTELVCLSDLFKNESLKEKHKYIDNYVYQFFNSNQEYVIELLELQGLLIQVNRESFDSIVSSLGILQALKSIGEYNVIGGASNKRIYCNKYVYKAILKYFEMPFEQEDDLLTDRINAGHWHTRICREISELQVYKYSEFISIIYLKIFGMPEYDLNRANKKQLQAVHDLEIELSTLIKIRYIIDPISAKKYFNLK